MSSTVQRENRRKERYVTAYLSPLRGCPLCAATNPWACAQGYLLPATVVHRRYANRQLFAETVFTYQRFQRFSADAEIRFEEVDTAPPKP